MDLGVKLEPEDMAPVESKRRAKGIWLPLAAFGLCLALFLVLAWRSGVFGAELTGETDEAAHYVTGLLVHDYVTSGFSVRPMAFATNFYLHYPKVALGHWPPMFYVVQAAWMFVFGDSPSAVILLIITMTATLAFLIYRTVHLEYGSALAGLGAAALFLCLPVVQMYGRMIMADMPVALFGFGAMLAWADFLSTGRRRTALLFAGLTVMAILTKGNGYAVIFIPPLSI